MLSRNTLFSFVLVWMLGIVVGCGDEIPPATDAGEPNKRLVILTPPGDDPGLSYNERVTLQVRYENDLAESVSGEPVEFSLTADGPGEDTAGSTLSASSAIANADGVARVDLVAGAQDATFRVSVEARDAPTQYFYVEISDGGFARLRITPVHEGWRSLSSFGEVQVRLYRQSQVRCADLNIDELPLSLSPPRSLDEFGGTLEFQSVGAGRAQTVVAWAQAFGAQARVSMGCVELGAEQLPPGLIEFQLVVSDRPLLADDAPVFTSFDLSPIVEQLAQMNAFRPWRVLVCDAGPGQLLLDCAIDALVDDGDVDCVIAGASDLADRIAARRGQLDESGCRALEDEQGGASLDAEVSVLIAQGEYFPVEDALEVVLGIRDDIDRGFALDSRLTTLGDHVFEHRLHALRAVTGSGEMFDLELAATDRPVLVQRPLTASWRAPVFTLTTHAFTARYGAFKRRAFTALALAPLGLEKRATSLGSALAASVVADPLSGCAALSEHVCSGALESADCLLAACEQGALALDAALTAWWRAFDIDGFDLSIAGSLRARDDDGDRVIEAVEQAADGEPWTATITTVSGDVVALPGRL